MRCVAIVRSALVSAASVRPKGSSSSARAIARRSMVGSREIMRPIVGAAAGAVGARQGHRAPAGAIARCVGLAQLERARGTARCAARRSARRRAPPPASAAARASKTCAAVARCAPSASAVVRGRPQRMQHQHEFAAAAVRVGREPGRQLGARQASRTVFELLGQLAAQRHVRAPGRPRRAPQQARRCDAAPRTAPASARRRPAAAAARARSPPARRQEADEREAAAPAHRPATLSAAVALLAPGDRHARDSRPPRRRDQRRARVADGRRARVADVGDALAAARAARAPLRRPRARCARARASSGGLVDAELAQQRRAVARVLAGHRVDQRAARGSRAA